MTKSLKDLMLIIINIVSMHFIFGSSTSSFSLQTHTHTISAWNNFFSLSFFGHLFRYGELALNINLPTKAKANGNY